MYESIYSVLMWWAHNSIMYVLLDIQIYRRAAAKNDMVQDRDKQINVRVYDYTRQKWKSHVRDNTEYGSMSELIRISVNRKIKEDNDDLNPWDVFTELIDDMDRLRQNQNDIESLIRSGIDQQVKSDELERKLQNLREKLINDEYIDDIDIMDDDDDDDDITNHVDLVDDEYMSDQLSDYDEGDEDV